MRRFNDIQGAIFDFDDVLVDTMGLKGIAFGTLFAQYGPEIVEKVRAYHFAHLGLSRFDKFQHYYQELLHEPIDEKILGQLSQQFQKLVLQEVLTAPWTAGALECLEGLSRQMPLFVVSSVPHQEIQEVLKRRDVQHLFRGIFGSPEKKLIHLRRIMQEYKLQPSQLIFVGDAAEDYEAAHDAGIHFVARCTKFNEQLVEELKKNGVPVVASLFELIDLV